MVESADLWEVDHASEFSHEWIYILSGRGITKIDDAEHEVRAEDFVGFPKTSVAHHLRNPFGDDLVYLSGGETHQLEVCNYPHQKLVLIRCGEATHVVPNSEVKKIR